MIKQTNAKKLVISLGDYDITGSSRVNIDFDNFFSLNICRRDF